GDDTEVFAHSTTDYTLSINRVGADTLETILQVKGTTSRQSNSYSLKQGCLWSPSRAIPTTHLNPGFYLLSLSAQQPAKHQWQSPLLVRSVTGRELVVVCPTHTWQAYNAYGGKSNYQDKVTPLDVSYLNNWLSHISATTRLAPYTYLPQRRPFLHPISKEEPTGHLEKINGKISSDLYLMEYLEKHNWKYDVIADYDFEKGIGLSNAKVVIFHNHSEYWSYEGMGMLKQLIAQGINVLFLSGNNIYREVEMVKGQSLKVIEQRTDRSAVEPITGTYYSDSGYELPLASFRVVRPHHWVFKGTDVEYGDSFGDGVISGVETDKLGPFSEGFQLLAIGENTSGPAHLVIKEFAQGNFLFNSSSISSVRALSTCDVWQQLVKNVIERGLTSTVPSN
ncbi:MAG: N,N-dimethylformamidase beta subunit family domain-containing protein, partial [Bacteroidota bacterium]